MSRAHVAVPAAVVVALALTIAAAVAPFRASHTAHASTTLTGLHVVGNAIQNGSGQAVQLLGVNRSGTEYQCVHNVGIFDGPVTLASFQVMQTWGINTVRVPLNEDCWLGINGINSAYAGANYQNAIAQEVANINAAGFAVILDLHWNAPGTTQATGQMQMADYDHAPAFWQSVATAFKSNTSVVFDLYNEPHGISWSCWRDGGNPCLNTTYYVAGMQTLLSAVRNTGASNLVIAGGLEYSNDLRQWLGYRPTDSYSNLAAAWHVYNFNRCVTTACYDAEIAPVAAQFPVVTGELGENDCAHGFIDFTMNWMDAHGLSYLGWSWNTASCASSPALISSYDGTPTNFGIGLKNHLLSLGSAPAATATNTPVAAPTATNTPVPATATNTPVPAATATFTPVPPTATFPPAPTAAPTSTATPLPAGANCTSSGLCITSFVVNTASVPLSTTVTFTATTNTDLSGTPYSLIVTYDDGGGIFRTCTSGTVCTAVIYSTDARLIHFVAYLTTTPSTVSGAAARSADVPVTWGACTTDYVCLTGLMASTSNAPLSTTVTLTATANVDVGPTPYAILIVDDVSGAILADCQFGSRCSVGVSSTVYATNHYAAYLTTSYTGNSNSARLVSIPVTWGSAPTATATATATATPTNTAVVGTCATRTPAPTATGDHVHATQTAVAAATKTALVATNTPTPTC